MEKVDSGLGARGSGSRLRAQGPRLRAQGSRRAGSCAILKTIDRSTKKGESRSETIERLLREGLAARARRAADARDLALINTHAEALNAEAEDVLRYQPGL